MGAAQVWRSMRRELLALVVFAFLVLELPAFINRLSRFRLADLIAATALWLMLGLVGMGVGRSWRRRSAKHPHALDEPTCSRYQH